MFKKNSIIQIARDAKCSTATVSRYFNGGYVSDQMKERIKISINKLNYTLSPIAKLMRGESDEIYVICDPRELSFNKNIIPHFVEKRNKLQTMFFSYLDYDNQNYFKMLLNIISRRPKAIIIINHTNDPCFFDFIDSNQTETNFFIVGGKNSLQWKNFNFPFYFIDESKIFSQLIELMLEKNKENICFIGIDYNETINNLWYYQERFLIFQKTIEKFNGKKNYTLLKNNTIEEATEKIIELQEKGFTNFICGTHTIYRAFCDVAKDYDISSDVGYWSLSDAKKKFTYKIFIPFETIAKDIIEDIQNGDNSKKTRTYYPKIM